MQIKQLAVHSILFSRRTATAKTTRVLLDCDQSRRLKEAYIDILAAYIGRESRPDMPGEVYLEVREIVTHAFP